MAINNMFVLITLLYSIQDSKRTFQGFTKQGTVAPQLTQRSPLASSTTLRINGQHWGACTSIVSVRCLRIDAAGLSMLV